MTPLWWSLLLLATIVAIGFGPLVVGEFVRHRRSERSDSDVFAGTRRTIYGGLPTGWVCDHAQWRWREAYRVVSEGFVVFYLEVYTRHEYTGEERWRPVGQGIPMYGGHIWSPGTEPDMPGTWRQDKIELPMDVNGEPVDVNGALDTCHRREK